MKKHLLWLLFAILFLILVLMMFYFSSWKNSSKLQGKLVFANTYNQGLVLDEVKIITAENVVRLTYKNKFWMVNATNDYFADFSMIHKLLSFFNSSTYNVKLPYSEEEAKNHFLNNPTKDKKYSGILLQTYAGGKLLDEVVLSSENVGDKYFFVRNMKDNYIWLVDNYFNLPTSVRGWLPAPVLNLLLDTLEVIRIDGDIVQRKKGDVYFRDEKGIKAVPDALLNVFANVFISDVVNEENFNKNTGVEKEREIEFTAYHGLKIRCKVFVLKNNEVWMNINLLTTPLPKSVVYDYIKDNMFLYDGKYFKISSDQAHVLKYFRLF